MACYGTADFEPFIRHTTTQFLCKQVNDGVKGVIESQLKKVFLSENPEAQTANIALGEKPEESVKLRGFDQYWEHYGAILSSSMLDMATSTVVGNVKKALGEKGDDKEDFGIGDVANENVSKAISSAFETVFASRFKSLIAKKDVSNLAPEELIEILKSEEMLNPPSPPKERKPRPKAVDILPPVATLSKEILQYPRANAPFEVNSPEQFSQLIDSMTKEKDDFFSKGGMFSNKFYFKNVTSVLNLGKVVFYESRLKYFCKLLNINSLVLVSTEMDATLKDIVKLQNAKIINLSNNKLKGELPVDIGKLLNLEQLELMNNELTGGIPASLANLAHLKVLNLNGNQLSTPFPRYLARLKTLESLSVAGNKFRGIIPEEIGEMSSLKSLDLSENLFVGKIPDGISKLHQLEKLQLGKNQLDGPIPTSLCELRRLTALFFFR